MKINYSTRGSGKTTYLINKSHKTNIPIVVNTSCDTKYIIEKCEKMHVEIPRPINIKEFLQNSERYDKVYIDELSNCFPQIIEATDTPDNNTDYGKDMYTFNLYTTLKHKLNDLTNFLNVENDPNRLLNILKAIDIIRQNIENINDMYESYNVNNILPN